MGNFFLVMALVCVACGIFSSMKIVSFLSGHGIKINYFLLRLFLPKYIGQYRKITMMENGRPGPWFYPFVVSMNLALMLAVTGILFKLLG